MPYLLHLLIAVPILGAIAILLGAPAKKTAMAAAAVNLLLTLVGVFSYDQAASGYQFQSITTLVPEWRLSYFLGVDGLSLVMLLLTALVTLAAIWVAPKVDSREGLYYSSLLFIAAGATGAFASLDLFFFYAFHELALIPTFLMIGIWGSGDRAGAAWSITIYLALGSIILLVGLLALYLSIPDAFRTFNIVELQALAAQGKVPQTSWIYLTILIGFGVLISLFPFHTWAPKAYASAPAPTAMLHAGVLKKFGLYGLLRVALPLLPGAAQEWTNLLLLLLAGNILYIGLVTIAQKSLDMTLGYSSVMHMGYIFLGIASFNLLGLNGAALLMFAHGLSIAVLFAIAGEVRERTGTLEYSKLGGLAKPLPFLGYTFGIAAFASIGLPGFGNFASEILVFFGAFEHAGTALARGIHFSNFQIVTIIALWGVVISAVYMLRAYRAAFLGETNKSWTSLVDLKCCVRPAIVLLLIALLVAGFRPQLFLNLITPTVKTFIAAQ